MNQVWVFIFGIVVGVAVVLFLVKHKLENKKDSKLIEEKRRQKEEIKRKILAILESKQRICNNDVEKTLGVSDATAERHLGELEKEDILKQVGKVGRSVYYEKV
jgi:predicted HTH transcriptional regulator